jgi:hypothetical protein
LSSSKDRFIQRWQQSSASERANYALFLSELCDYLDLPRPDPSQADESTNTYVIDKAVFYTELDGSSTTNFIDLYRRSCFVLEAKQGSNPVLYSSRARTAAPNKTRHRRAGNARMGHRNARGAWAGGRYAKALPATEGWPPFLIVVDVGHSIELFADFSLTGKAYLPFPGPRNFRVLLQELEQPAIRDRLRAVWLAPHSLDPSWERAKVTREVAAKLAVLARKLEQLKPSLARSGCAPATSTPILRSAKMRPLRSTSSTAVPSELASPSLVTRYSCPWCSPRSPPVIAIRTAARRVTVCSSGENALSHG